MQTRLYLAKLVTVACSMLLSCAYIYYRSGGEWFSSSAIGSQSSADSDRRLLAPNAAPGFNPSISKYDKNGPANADAASKAKGAQAKMMMGGTKSAVIFTLLDEPAGKGGATQGRGSS